jgi:hypothetical protein
MSLNNLKRGETSRLTGPTRNTTRVRGAVIALDEVAAKRLLVKGHRIVAKEYGRTKGTLLVRAGSKLNKTVRGERAERIQSFVVRAF